VLQARNNCTLAMMNLTLNGALMPDSIAGSSNLNVSRLVSVANASLIAKACAFKNCSEDCISAENDNSHLFLERCIIGNCKTGVNFVVSNSSEVLNCVITRFRTSAIQVERSNRILCCGNYISAKDETTPANEEYRPTTAILYGSGVSHCTFSGNLVANTHFALKPSPGASLASMTSSCIVDNRYACAWTILGPTDPFLVTRDGSNVVLGNTTVNVEALMYN
jgi:hypothetical protein